MPCGDRCHWAMVSFCFVDPIQSKSGAARLIRQIIHSITLQPSIAAFLARALFVEQKMDGARAFSWWGMITKFRLLQLEVMFRLLFLSRILIRLLKQNLTRPR